MRVGFEVRVEVSVDDQPVVVTLTRTQFQALGIAVGSPVWVRAVPGAPTVPALHAVGEPAADGAVLVGS